MTIKKIIIVMLLGCYFVFSKTPEDWRRPEKFRIVVVNAEDIGDVFPGDIKIVKVEISGSPSSTIDKIEFVSGTGIELSTPLPSYGKKKLSVGEVIFIEFKIHITIGGSQSFWLRISSHDEKGNPDPRSSSGGLSIFNWATMRVRSLDEIRYGGAKRYGSKDSYTQELQLAEKEEKVRKGPPIRIELPFVAGSGHTLTIEERVAIQSDITGKNTPQWYKDWIFSNHWYKEMVKRDWQH